MMLSSTCWCECQIYIFTHRTDLDGVCIQMIVIRINLNTHSDGYKPVYVAYGLFL